MDRLLDGPALQRWIRHDVANRLPTTSLTRMREEESLLEMRFMPSLWTYVVRRSFVALLCVRSTFRI
jgi:hypothetical protein